MHDEKVPTVRRATIRDVARHAGVSHQTVARFLRGERVRSSTKDILEASLAELDYRPNEVARALATNRSLRIGAFSSDMAQWAPHMIMTGAADEARRAGYVLDFIPVDTSDSASVSHAVSTMAQSRLAGVVVLAASDEVLNALDLAELECPVVIQAAEPVDGLGERHPEPDFAIAVRHLLSLGHERLFHISGPMNWAASRARAASAHFEAAAHNARVVGEAEGDWSARSGFEAMERRFDASLGATAVLAANDQMALGALSWLTAHGIGVPTQVSVVGFDGQPDSEFYVPGLTTVAVDYLALGQQVVAQLLGGFGLDLRPPVPSARLVVRASTGGPSSAVIR